MKRYRNQRGAALLEAAITVPIILLISVGIFEFGRAYQTWQVLTNAAREGARLAVIQGSTDADVTTTVRNYMQSGALPNYASEVLHLTAGGINESASGSADAGQPSSWRHSLPVRIPPWRYFSSELA